MSRPTLTNENGKRILARIRKIKPFVQASLSISQKKCGNSTCRCAREGPVHETALLTWIRRFRARRGGGRRGIAVLRVICHVINVSRGTQHAFHFIEPVSPLFALFRRWPGRGQFEHMRLGDGLFAQGDEFRQGGREFALL